jgi:hypothetical protein
VVTSKLPASSFNVNFTNCLWKVKNNPSNLASATNIISNQDPVFDSINVSKRIFNFRLKDSSPAIKAGANAGVVSDLDGNPRPVNQPDLGAYQKQ